MNRTARRFIDSKESIFARMTHLAQQKKAINLAQGFPDFRGPDYLINRLHMHLDSCSNQYTRSAGHPALVHALAEYYRPLLPRAYDALEEVTVVNGATEGILCAIVGLVDPGKKVMAFEPYYESYIGCTKVAGCTLIGVPLLPPNNEEDVEKGIWHIDWEIFDHAINDDLAMIILNHPHNPTGKVFSMEELRTIFAHAKKLNIPIVIDGVYENLVYPPCDKYFAPFLSEYRDHIIYISGISKTLSFTGFKVGWLLANKIYMRAIRAVHEAAVYCSPPHLQLAVADILQEKEFMGLYLDNFRRDFIEKRDRMRALLNEFGFLVPRAQGSYFLLAKKHRAPLKSTFDQDMALELLHTYGVATIPISGFYTGQIILQDWVRFAFCKKAETIDKLKETLGLALKK